LLIPNNDCRGWQAGVWSLIGKALDRLAKSARVAAKLRDRWRFAGQPERLRDTRQGHEDFDFPGTWRLLELPVERPDIVHGHNLHGGYFDLRALPWLSRQVPVVLTLHDSWLLSGHCAYALGCERWKMGCGHCPDLTLYPAIEQDSTAYNWGQKREIYAQSRLYVATPCRWLMEMVEQSILAPAVVEARVIPYGVDLSVFCAADKQAIRQTLGVPAGARVLLFVAKGICRNPYKDYRTVRSAVGHIAQRLPGERVLFVALGEAGSRVRIGEAEVRFVPYQKDPKVVARYYQAADVLVHAARADTFPNAILESLACGTPVVATAVGGIPEQIRGLRGTGCALNEYGADQATGVLAPPGDAEGLAAGVSALLSDDRLCAQLGENAARDARRRFDQSVQVKRYVDWYQEIIARWDPVVGSPRQADIAAVRGAPYALPNAG
jgi:glycosyltransferase involved in cell wall biosynthesis